MSDLRVLRSKGDAEVVRQAQSVARGLGLHVAQHTDADVWPVKLWLFASAPGTRTMVEIPLGASTAQMVGAITAGAKLLRENQIAETPPRQ